MAWNSITRRLKKRLEKTLKNRPDMIWSARQTGMLSLEAEKMIEEITEQISLKNVKNKKRKKAQSTAESGDL